MQFIERQKTTELVLQLDIWSTFSPYVNFGYCYVERGHIGIANEASFTNYGRDYLTVPEGLDTGSNYSIVKTVDRYMTDDGQFPGNVEWYSILVASSIDLGMADPGNDWNSAKFDIASGGRFSGIVSGAKYYIWPNAATFRNFLDAYKSKPWILQGIISISIIPGIGRYWPGFAFGDTNASPFFGMVEAPPYPPAQPSYSMMNNWRESSEILDYIPERYRNLEKLRTFPYMALELTTYSGTSVILHPELWPEPHAPLQEVSSFVPPDQRIMIFPVNYNVHETDKLGYAVACETIPASNLITLPSSTNSLRSLFLIMRLLTISRPIVIVLRTLVSPPTGHSSALCKALTFLTIKRSPVFQPPVNRLTRVINWALVSCISSRIWRVKINCLTRWAVRQWDRRLDWRLAP